MSTVGHHLGLSNKMPKLMFNDNNPADFKNALDLAICATSVRTRS